MRSPASAAAAPAPRAATPPPKFIRPKFERMSVELKQLKNWVLIRKDQSGQKAQSNRRDSAQAGATAAAITSASVRRSDVMHSRATDRRSASKCQGKWPDQTLDQAFGLPEVLVAVSTSRLSCKRAGKTRTLTPVGIHLETLGLRLSAPRMQRSCAMRLCLTMSGGRVLMRQLLVCFSILFLLGDSAYWTRGDTAGTPVDNGSPTPSTSGDARGHSGDQSDIVGKLRSGGDKSSTDTTWSQGLTLGANGPIPVIVVDQFGYPTKASKIAVIRDPQMGYDNVVSFTPGTTYAVVDKSTGKIVKKGPPDCLEWRRHRRGFRRQSMVV